MIDDFEQESVDLDVFKGWLLVDDLNGPRKGEYYWGVSDCRSKTGDKSAWAIGNGTDGLLMECGEEYPADVKSSATLRLDLSGWAMDTPALELVFDFWLNVRTEGKLSPARSCPVMTALRMACTSWSDTGVGTS